MEIEILKVIDNVVIAKRTERNFPGVLIQGDSLSILLGEIREIKEEISNRNYTEASEIAEVIDEKITALLISYEQVLKENNIELPYIKSVQIKKPNNG